LEVIRQGNCCAAVIGLYLTGRAVFVFTCVEIPEKLADVLGNVITTIFPYNAMR
jgi:hypothetical protein